MIFISIRLKRASAALKSASIVVRHALTRPMSACWPIAFGWTRIALRCVG